MPKLRTAIIGLGMMGTNHARVLSNLEGVELVAVADPQGDAQNVLPSNKVLKSVDEVIKLGVDYCVISAPTAFHEEIASQLIASGIHFLVEKPIADSYASAVKIRDAAKSANVTGAVGHIERFNSALQEARKRVLAGELGTIYQVATRRQGPFPSRISDVGVVKDLATHDIDLTSWITGKNYLQVSANAAFRSGREHEDLISVCMTGGEIAKDATDEKGGGGFGGFVRKGALLPEEGDAGEGDEADRAEDPVGMLVAVQQAEGHARVVDADDVEETGDHFDEILGRSIVRETLQDEPLRPLVEGEERCGEEEKVSDHAG